MEESSLMMEHTIKVRCKIMKCMTMGCIFEAMEENIKNMWQ